MRLSFWEGVPPGGIGGASLQGLLDELCARRQSVFLATPYLSFESRLLGMEEGSLLLRAPLSRQAAQHTLKHPALRVRFPWALTIYSGQVRLLDYEQSENRRILKISVPEALTLDEPRRAYRVEDVGRSFGAVSTQDGEIVRVSLDSLSTLGCGLFCLEPIPAGKMDRGAVLGISVMLEQGFELRVSGQVCHGTGQSLGLAFQPPLEGIVLAQLEAWLEPRREKAMGQWANRAEIRAQAERAARPKRPPEGLLLVSRGPELESEVRGALDGGVAFRVVPPVLPLFREALEHPPLLVMLDVSGFGPEERHRLKALLAAVPVACPILVLGSAKAEEPRAFAQEIKAAAGLEWSPQRTSFFQRLVQGLIRSYRKTLDLPDA